MTKTGKQIMNTRFNKEDFTWDGMYLMYTGEHTQSKYYELPCHPTRVGTPRSEFIARFKYGNYKPWKAWVNFIVKNFTVEEYLNFQQTFTLEVRWKPKDTQENKVRKGLTLGKKGSIIVF
jgi:hypothetical protein